MFLKQVEVSEVLQNLSENLAILHEFIVVVSVNVLIGMQKQRGVVMSVGSAGRVSLDLRLGESDQQMLPVLFRVREQGFSLMRVQQYDYDICGTEDLFVASAIRLVF